METIQMLPARETERMMKLQDVILKAIAKKITWIDAAEIAGMSVRNMQRKRQGYEKHGYTGLFDQRRGKRSIHRIPMETVEKVLALYRDKYPDFNVRHFHEKLREIEGIQLSYSWVRQALQGAGLVARRRKRGPHRRRRPRRPLPGMMLHIDGSKHRWFQDDRYYDLIVILDDATSEIYYAQLVEEESTRTVMQGVREVIERKGLFCSLYSDRGSHFFCTPKAGEPVDKQRPTQFGRALKELGVQMIAAYSPQARGRSERNFGTWQGRLPQELRLAGIESIDGANQFLRESYIAEFNKKFTVKPAEKGTAFRKSGRGDLDWIFSLQTERVVGKDNTVAIKDRWWQIDKCRWRHSLAGQTVTIHEHLDQSVSIRFGPHVVGHFDKDGGKAGAMENPRRVSHSSLEIAPGDSHFPTAPAAISPPSSKSKPKKVA
ncbi:MAG: ISNCY family transposase [Bryobacter sp.]|nr:ISNCY family transposase [Bryobacter sp. CoA8 C33]